MITTVITFYNAASRQFYVRLQPGIVEDNEKVRLCRDMNALAASQYNYNEEPKDVNLLYFQEFDEPDTKGIYFNINGDRQIYDLLEKFGRPPDYII